MINTERFKAMAAAAGFTLSGEQRALLDGYCALLMEANEHVNLTAITDAAQVEQKHLLDSLYAAALPEMRGDVIDVGTGAGFPGAAIKIYRPELRLTLLDATRKKVSFVARAAEQLDVELLVKHGRAEQLGKTAANREKYDTAVARAVASLPVLCELCLPLVKPGGYFIAMKSADVDRELELAQEAIAALGGALSRVEKYTLPDGDGRSLVVIEKTVATPEKYPREYKKIVSERLD